MVYREPIKWFWAHYLNNPSEATHPCGSPLRSTDVSGLQPILVVTAEYNRLGDEGELDADKLRAAVVPVILTHYNGVNHEFMFWIGLIDKVGLAMAESRWLSGIFAAQVSRNTIPILPTTQLHQFAALHR